MNQLNDEEILFEYNVYIQNIGSGIKQVAEYFRTDQIDKALKGVLDFAEGMTWLNLSNEYLSAKQKIVKQDFKEIEEFLEEINTGLQLKDYILVADILEYEMISYFERI